MLNLLLIDYKCTVRLGALVVALLAALCLGYGSVVDGRSANPARVAVHPLSAPSGVVAAEPDPETAFREEDAGISAYLRVSAQPGGGSQTRLNVKSIVDVLTSLPDDASIRGAGKLVDWGANFGIVELPMTAAVISPAPVENVTVYFDDQGWIVTYLPHDRPAAALWKHGSADGGTVDDAKADEDLERNLLVIAINEVMTAHDPGAADVNPSEVTYYDWTCPQCDAFVLFSGVSSSGTPDEIKFVVPYTISLVRASAAVVMTEQIDIGDSVTANVAVAGKVIATANADKPLNSASFNLARDVDSTSLHRVVIDSPPDNVSVGAILLVYDRP